MTDQPPAHVADDLRHAIDWLIQCAAQNASWDSSNRIISKESRDEYDTANARARVEALTATAFAGKVTYEPDDLNSYSLILSILGMEEEGDPVAEVQRLFDADRAAGAPAETPKPNIVPYEVWQERIACARIADNFAAEEAPGERRYSGNVISARILARTTQRVAAQPAPAPAAKNAREARRIGYWYPEHGQAFISDTTPPGSEPIYAAMLSANSPREAG